MDEVKLFQESRLVDVAQMHHKEMLRANAADPYVHEDYERHRNQMKLCVAEILGFHYNNCIYDAVIDQIDETNNPVENCIQAVFGDIELQLLNSRNRMEQIVAVDRS